ncbi:hypothetical protein SBOR_2638 [Sclerotinia borealis F-4128]|uniref:DUF7918 domain-containing protein n=1 Tax=Sclerotinia borealis (strain F-4128) TaxID=1432307 RepID=W9CMA5_SCLBF|nr:hypothetical protein SBOR_2638 [Sclerotinia borealis F-4128]
MAVLEAVSGIKVTVCVDDEALQEYDDDEFEAVPGDVGAHQASRTVAKYVESCTDKSFSIKIEMGAEYKFDSPNLTRRIRGRLTKPKNAPNFLEPFIFSNIITSVDDAKLASVKEDAQRLSVVGEIIVKLYRRGEKLRVLNESKSREKLDRETHVHEKALKGQAMSHSTTLGAPEIVKTSKTWRLNHLDGDDCPIAIYRFKIPSIPIDTQKNPRAVPFPPPSPIPNEASGDFDIENLNAAQKAKLQEFLGALMGNGTPSNAEKKIKREREEADSGFTARKRSKNSERVEIDLTGDDED